MNEIALLNKETGKIANVVTTPRTAAQVAEMYPGYDVKPLDEVPDQIKVQYQFWDDRPQILE